MEDVVRQHDGARRNGQALHSVGPAELRHRVRVELRAARGVGGAGASGRRR